MPDIAVLFVGLNSPISAPLIPPNKDVAELLGNTPPLLLMLLFNCLPNTFSKLLPAVNGASGGVNGLEDMDDSAGGGDTKVEFAACNAAACCST